MPKTTRKNGNRNTKNSSRVKNKPFNFSGIKLKDKKVFFGFIILVALLGITYIGLSSAASSTFEAENGKLSKTVITGEDANASGGKYVQFSVGETTTLGEQRFPGDPNPLKTGKAYWGAGIAGNGDPARHEGPAGKSLSIRRTFWAWNNPKMINTAKADIAANRLPFISIKTPGWNAVASGKHDAELDNMLKQLDVLGGPVWFVVHHEPEGGCNNSCQGPKGEDDAAGAAGWRAVQQKVRQRMDAVGTKNIAFMPVLMSWTWDSRSNRNPEDWWVPNVWDAYIVDSYAETAGAPAESVTGWKNFVSWIEKKGLPFGTAEWGIRTIENGSWQKASGNTGTWTNEDCAPENMILKQTTSEQESIAEKNMSSYWNYGFTNKKDIIAHSYFDSCLNSSKGPWTLAKKQLSTFQDILKNDGRVQRINDLGSGTVSTTNFGTTKSTVQVPETGNYKIWVRMNVPDTANNAVQVDIGKTASMKVGDGNIPANTWTWVDWQNGNTNDKTTVALEAGNQTITVTGIEKGVKVDKILITNLTCKPTGVGDDCSTVVPPTQDQPTVTITSPKAGAVVYGNAVKVRVDSNGDVNRVTFRPNNVWAFTAESAPYEWTWDTTKVPDGEYTIVTRTNFQGDPGNVYTEREIKVTVKNKSAPSTPADTTPPNEPTNIQRSISFSPSGFRCSTKLSWTPSTSKDTAGYRITRDGLDISTQTAEYVDNGLTKGKSYTYSISAYDTAGNASKSITMPVKYNQFLWWCWFE